MLVVFFCFFLKGDSQEMGDVAAPWHVNISRCETIPHKTCATRLRYFSIYGYDDWRETSEVCRLCTQFPAKTVPKGLHYKHLRPYL